MAVISILFEDAVGRDAVAALPPPLLDEFRRDFTPPAGRLLVTYDPASRAITGCAAFRRVNRATCEVRRMVVNWDEQRRGLGRRLMGALAVEAWGAGYRTIVASVPEAVRALAAFYDRLFRWQLADVWRIKTPRRPTGHPATRLSSSKSAGVVQALLRPHLPKPTPISLNRRPPVSRLGEQQAARARPRAQTAGRGVLCWTGIAVEA